jgi:hypothetical protein
MPFLAKEKVPIPTKDLLSWVRIDTEESNRNRTDADWTSYLIGRPSTTCPTTGTIP